MKGMTRSGNIILTIIFSLALGSLSGCTDPLGQNIYAANIGVLLEADSVQPGGSYNLGDVTINQATEITITIRNTGNEVLELGGADAIVFSGEYASFFSLQDAPSAAVGAGEEVTGTLVCLPTAAVGDFSVEAMIASNAGNEEELTLTLTGKAVNEDGVVDTASPTVTVTSVAGGITDEEDIPFTVSFSEPVFGFTEDDLDITVDTGTYTVSGFSANAEGDEYTLQVTLDTESAEVTVGVSAGVAADAVGNENTASASACVVVYDTSVLTVKTLSIEGPGTITNQSPLDVTIKFSEEVEGFTAGDVELCGGWQVTTDSFNENNNPLFFVTIEAGEVDGVVTIRIPEGAATAVATGRGNSASEQIEFTYDSTPPDTPSFLGIRDGAYNINQTFTVENIEPGATVEYSLDDGTNWLTYAESVTLEEEGIYDVTARQTDAVGNTSENATTIGIIIDKEAPSIPSVDGDPSPTTKKTPRWTWFTGGGGNGTYRYRLDNDDLTAEPETDVTSYEPDSDLSNGTHTLFVQEKDDAGNWSDSGSYNIRVGIFSVTYNGRGHDGGTVPTDATYYTPGEEVAVQSGSNLYINGTNDRFFVYWSMQPDGSGTFYVPEGGDYPNSFTMGTSDITLYAIYIGDRGPAGGWIYYDDQDPGSVDLPDARFLEAAYEDDSTSVVWGDLSDINGNNSSVPPELTGIGKGYANTEKIVEVLGDNGGTDYAAKLCWEHQPPVTPNWFLPSKDELNKMYENLYKNGIGGFSNTVYYSSTEYSPDGLQFAWAQYFEDGSQGNNGKIVSKYARASRTF